MPWKLAEYLAVGAAIVCEPLNTEFMADPPVVFYRTVSECVESVTRLIKEPEAASSLGKSGHAFFHRQIRPDQMVRHALLSLTR